MARLLDNLYEAASKQYDLGSPEDFRKSLSNPQNVKNFYKVASHTFDLGNEEDFASTIQRGLDEYKEEQQPQQIAQPVQTVQTVQQSAQPIVEQQDYETDGVNVHANNGDTRIDIPSDQLPQQQPKKKTFLDHWLDANSLMGIYNHSQEQKGKYERGNEVLQGITDSELEDMYQNHINSAKENKKFKLEQLNNELEKIKSSTDGLTRAQAEYAIRQEIKGIEGKDDTDFLQLEDKRAKDAWDNIKKERTYRNANNRAFLQDENQIKGDEIASSLDYVKSADDNNLKANGYSEDAKKNLSSASYWNTKAKEILNAGSKYDNSVSVVNWAEGLANELADRQISGIASLVESSRVEDIMKKFNDAGMNEETPKYGLEDIFTKDELDLFNSYLDYLDAIDNRKDDLSLAYQIGQISGQSAPFMIDMVLTRGVSTLAKKGILAAMMKTARGLKGAEQVAQLRRIEKMAKILDGATLTREGGINVAGKTLGASKEFGKGELKRYIAREAVETPLQTFAMPTSYNSMNQQFINNYMYGKHEDGTKLGPNERINFLDWFRAGSGAMVETSSERLGEELIGWTVGKLMPIDKFFRGTKNPVARNLTEYLNDPLTEVGGEYFGAGMNALRSLNGLYSQESNQQMMDEVKDMFTLEGFLKTAGGVGLTSGAGAVINATPVLTSSWGYNASSKALREQLIKNGATDTQADIIMQQLEASTSKKDMESKLMEFKTKIGSTIENSGRPQIEKDQMFTALSNAVDSYHDAAIAFNRDIDQLNKAYASLSEEDKQKANEQFAEVQKALDEYVLNAKKQHEQEQRAKREEEIGRQVAEAFNGVEHSDNNIYEVVQELEDGTTRHGFIKTGNVVTIEDKDGNQSLYNSDSDLNVGVQWDDADGIEDVNISTLQLAAPVESKEDRLKREDAAIVNREESKSRFHTGDVVIIGEGNGAVSTTIVNVDDDGVVVNDVDPQTQQQCQRRLTHEEALNNLVVADRLLGIGALTPNIGERVEFTQDGKNTIDLIYKGNKQWYTSDGRLVSSETLEKIGFVPMKNAKATKGMEDAAEFRTKYGEKANERFANTVARIDADIAAAEAELAKAEGAEALNVDPYNEQMRQEQIAAQKVVEDAKAKLEQLKEIKDKYEAMVPYMKSDNTNQYGITIDSKLNNVTTQEQQFLGKVAKQLGVEIQVVDNLDGANGMIVGNRIVLSAKSINRKGVAFIIGHEMTHYIKSKGNKRMWNAYVQLVKKSMGDEFQKKFDQMRKDYDEYYEKMRQEGKQFENLSDDGIEEEVVCDYAGEHILTDENFMFGIINEVAENKEEAKNIIQQILEWLKDALKAIKDTDAAQAVQAAADMWGKMYEMVAAGNIEIKNDNNKKRFSLVRQNETDYEANINDLSNDFNNKLLSTQDLDQVSFDLGLPSDMLLHAGVNDLPIYLEGSKLKSKMRKHNIDKKEIIDLPKFLQDPIAVFDGNDNAHIVLTEMSTQGGNVVIILKIGKDQFADFDVVSSVYGKNFDNVVRWINNGKLLTVNKEKALNYLGSSAPIADPLNNQELNSAAKIVQNFDINKSFGEKNAENVQISKELPEGGYKFSIIKSDEIEKLSNEYFGTYYEGNGEKKERFAPFANQTNPITKEELEAANTVIRVMADYVRPYLDQVNEGKRVLPNEVYGTADDNTIMKNGSYGRTIENTTICLRTLSYNDFVDNVKNELGRPLTQRESFLASQMVYEIAKDPQCLYCYVALDRKAYDEFLIRYIEDRDNVLAAYDALNNKDTKGKAPHTAFKKLYEDYLNGRKDTKNQQNRFDSWIINWEQGNKFVTLNDVRTDESRSAIRTGEDKWMAEQILDIEAYARSASWAKKNIDYRSYTGELLKITNGLVNQLMSEYGLRFYSFSEFSPAFIVENMQMVRDAALRGLKGLGYTKETDFIRIFAPTGMNINCSVYGRKDSNGNIVMDDKQGANWDEVKELRAKYPNVGAVFVATDDAAAEWALAQDWVDVVIPFHIVRTGADIAGFYGWTNYNNTQADTFKNSAKSKYISPAEHKNSKEVFLQLCEKEGLTPRFEKFVNNPNFMKLVNETRRSVDETKEIKPIFNMDEAKKSFDAFVEKGGYYGGWWDVDEKGYIGSVQQVAEDVLAGKSANEVEYGRQDMPINTDKLTAAARKIRQHRNTIKYSIVTPEEKAKAIFDPTNEVILGSYVLADGTILDTGSQYGSFNSYWLKFNTKTVEHIYNDGRDNKEVYDDFIGRGNIEYNPYHRTMTVGAEINEDQYKPVSDIIKRLKNIRVRFNGRDYEGYRFHECDPKFVIDAINEYYKNGVEPNRVNTGTDNLDLVLKSNEITYKRNRKISVKQIFKNNGDGGQSSIDFYIIPDSYNNVASKELGYGGGFSNYTYVYIPKGSIVDNNDGTNTIVLNEEITNRLKEAVLNKYLSNIERTRRIAGGLTLYQEEFINEYKDKYYKSRGFSYEDGKLYIEEKGRGITNEDNDNYLSAVESGNLKQAEKYVELAASNFTKLRRNGKPAVFYHGSKASTNGNNAPFEVFKTTSKYEIGSHFGTLQQAERVNDAVHSIFKVYLSVNNPIIFEWDSREWSFRYIGLTLKNNGYITKEQFDSIDALDSDKQNEELSKILIENGYDGIIYNNKYEGEGESVLVLSPNQIKSANTVVKDYNGNIIPLSERFNSNNDDIRFSIIGEEGARMIDRYNNVTTMMDNLDAARKMEKELKPDWQARTNDAALKIKVATGWERGADNMWRHEEVDTYLTDEAYDKIENARKGFTIKLGEMVEQEGNPLFIAYPKLKDLEFFVTTQVSNMLGVYRDGDGKLTISVKKYFDVNKANRAIIELNSLYKKRELLKKNGLVRTQTYWDTESRISELESIKRFNLDKIQISKDKLESVLNHEIQHFIQHQEGFAEGGMPGMLDPRSKYYEEWADAYTEFYRGKAIGADKSVLVKISDKCSKLRNKINRLNNNDYQNLAGEVESRNVQVRMNMTPEERRNTLLTSTEIANINGKLQDVSRKDLIFIKSTGNGFRIVMNTMNNLTDQLVDDGIIIEPMEEEQVRYSLVTNPQEIMDVWEDGYETRYQSALKIDGKYYPPMNTRSTTNNDGKRKLGEPLEFNKTYKSEEHPELAIKDGDVWHIKLDGKTYVAWNPYFHTTNSPLNDQFKAAYRKNLVLLEVRIPKSQLDGGRLYYKAEGAKDGTGLIPWNKGEISNELAKQGKEREVYLTQYINPVREVPVDEVADKIIDWVGDSNIQLPVNVVTPELRDALAERGMQFAEPNLTLNGKYAKDAQDFLDKQNARFSVGTHAGDLGKANDTYLLNMGGRSTGHFGTGTYFVGDESRLVYNYANRPMHKIEFNNYNMFRPKDAEQGMLLHRLLGKIDDNWGEDTILSNANEYTIAQILGVPQAKVIDALDAVKEQVRNPYDRMDRAEWMEYAKDKDSAATVFMKALGFEGVDVTGIDGLDNTDYGSVIYDLHEEDKPSTRFSVAFHGSAADFDKFDRKYAGTGEGQAIMGHGIYVAESKGAAEYYATTVQEMRRHIIQKGGIYVNGEYNDDRQSYNAYEDIKKYGSADKAIEELGNKIKNWNIRKGIFSNTKPLEDRLQWLKDHKDDTIELRDEIVDVPNRYVYTVTIPDDNGKNYLDWNKGVSLSNIKKARQILEERINEGDPNWLKQNKDIIDYEFQQVMTDRSGGLLYGAVDNLIPVEFDASDVFKEMGYKGIKGKAQQGSNYVIFDADDVKIDGKTRFSLAYHGTSKDFENFDLSYVGSGQGENAHGYGVYVTFDEEFGKYHAQVASERQKTEYIGGHKDGFQDWLFVQAANEISKYGSYDKALEHFKQFEGVDSYGGNIYNALKNSSAEDYEQSKKYLYTVDIPNDNGHNYLQEMKTVDKQDRKRIADHLRTLDDALLERDSYGPNWMRDGWNTLANVIERKPLSGKEIYDKIYSAVLSSKLASNILSDAGIVGIKFRLAGKDNAVIFKDSDVKKVSQTRFSLVDNVVPKYREFVDAAQEQFTLFGEHKLSPKSFIDTLIDINDKTSKDGNIYSILNGVKGVLDKSDMGEYFDMDNNELLEYIGSLLRDVVTNNIRYSLDNSSNVIFVSNAEKAVNAIKQDKATPQQWKAMLEKQGGLKAGEDKWIGLSQWLDEQTEKTLTKEQVLNFIKENKIQIEEVRYKEDNALPPYEIELDDDEIKEIERVALGVFKEIHGWENEDELKVVDGYVNTGAASQSVLDEFWENGEALQEEYRDIKEEYINMLQEEKYMGQDANGINSTRLGYTTKFLDNKQEIALTVPTIDSWNADDDIHFGDAGDGRAVAWIRFGDTILEIKNDDIEKARKEWKKYINHLEDKYELNWIDITDKLTEEESRKSKELQENFNMINDANKNVERVLVIDEVQSKRHQDAREKGGYRNSISLEYQRQINEYQESLLKKYNCDRASLYRYMSEEEDDKLQHLIDLRNESSNRSDIPDAPFDKNWMELCMKRMLRYAADNGYDRVAWTNGDMQAERYNIGELGKGLFVHKSSIPNKYHIWNENKDDYDVMNLDEKGLADYIGKDAARDFINSDENELDLSSARIDGEGMRTFYDQFIPRFMDKYCRQWGVKTEDVTLLNLENKEGWHSVPVTEAMVQDVQQGQPMFSVDNDMPKWDGKEPIGDFIERSIAWRAEQGESKDAIEAKKQIDKQHRAFQIIAKKITDYALPLKNYLEWAEKKGATSEGLEDAYEDVTLASGRTTQQIKKFDDNFIRPIGDFIAQLKKSKKLANISIYWQNIDDETLDTEDEKKRVNGTKLDEDQVMAVYAQAKDAIQARQLGDADRGYDAFAYNLGHTPEQIVEMVESAIGEDATNNFWDLVYAATSYVLDYQVEVGMLAKEDRDQFTRRYYVPQRGWSARDLKKNSGQQVDDYVAQGAKLYQSPYNAALIKAKGRSSLAASPFPYIMSMGHSAIITGETNKTRQKFLNWCLKNEIFGLKNKTFKIASIYVKNTKTEDGRVVPETVYASPTATEMQHDAEIRDKQRELRKKWFALDDVMSSKRATRDDIVNAMAKKIEIEKQVQELEDQLIYRGFAMDDQIKQVTKDEKIQHQVSVMLDGRKYVIFLQDEQLANAINKNYTKSMSQFAQDAAKVATYMTRYLSAILTQYNPEFAVTNFLKDWQVSEETILAEHGPEVLARFQKNLLAVQPAIWSYVFQDKIKNKQQFTNGKYGKYLEEYVNSGAPTGFSFLEDVGKLQETFRLMSQSGFDVRKSLRKGVDALSILTEVSELTNRFAFYVAARESGQSVDKAAYNSKELTTNFDRKGEVSNSAVFSIYCFLKATINGNLKFLRAFAKNATPWIALAAIHITLGILNQALLPDEPDDEVYISDYTRQSNYVFKIGNVVMKFPVPHFMRIFHSLGVNMAMAQQGSKTMEKAMFDAIQYGADELLPSFFNIANLVRFDENTNETRWLDNDAFMNYLQGATPSSISPIVDVAINRNFMGSTINKETIWNENDKDITKAKENTAKHFKDISDAIYIGNPNVESRLDDNKLESITDISASTIEHITEGYLSGVFETASLLAIATKYAITKEKLEKKDIPFLRKVVVEYNNYRAYSSEYYDLVNKAKTYEGYLKDLEENDQTKFDKEKNSVHYQILQEIKDMNHDGDKRGRKRKDGTYANDHRKDNLLLKENKPSEDKEYTKQDVKRLMELNNLWNQNN